MPNCLPPLVVVATIQVAHAISLEATLSFLGVGLPAGDFISWGNDISAAQLSLRTDPMPLIYPSLALSCKADSCAEAVHDNIHSA